MCNQVPPEVTPNGDCAPLAIEPKRAFLFALMLTSMIWVAVYAVGILLRVVADMPWPHEAYSWPQLVVGNAPLIMATLVIGIIKQPRGKVSLRDGYLDIALDHGESSSILLGDVSTVRVGPWAIVLGSASWSVVVPVTTATATMTSRLKCLIPASTIWINEGYAYNLFRSCIPDAHPSKRAVLLVITIGVLGALLLLVPRL